MCCISHRNLYGRVRAGGCTDFADAGDRHETTDMTLTPLLADQAMRHADADAVVDVSRTLSWAECADRAGRLASALAELDVSLGDRVGVCAHKGASGFLGMHAVVAIGAIAVPVDPAAPHERKRRIIESMGIDVMLCDGRTVGDLEPVPGLRTLRLDDESIDSLVVRPPRVVAPEAVAYIITSSGSTGEPKGIVHTHDSAMAYVRNSLELFPLDSTDRVSDIAPHHFDISTHSLWSCPAAGAAIVVMPEMFQQFPASHSQRLQDEGVTHWYSVPFVIQQMVLRGDLENRDLSALRWVQFGGEVIPASMLASFMAHAPNARLANVFGPAETNMCTFHVLDHAPDPDDVVPIGIPTPRTTIRLIDPEAAIPGAAAVVDDGEPGVAWVSGAGVMKEYWDAPERNARVFAEVDGSRWYRTGDVVSVRPSDGLLHFHGREDMQVKVRGHRIEIEGVEVELESIDGVDAVVVGIARATGGEDVLVAGVVTPPESFDEDAFLAAGRTRLPTWSMPTRIVKLTQPVFTGSGKLARRVLREHAVEQWLAESTQAMEETT